MPEMDGFGLIAELRRRPELTIPPIVMLTSAGDLVTQERRQELGLAACLLKPVRQAELHATICETLGQAGPAARASRVTQTPTQTTNGALRILLAEDNLVNQRLAIRVLQKQGHTVTTVINGQEALAAILDTAPEQRFDLVLMDVQMPEMSGMEVTEIIRAREQSTGEHLPIVALTAHAMKGDRERCLECGMDGYVSKPLQAAELHQTIAEVYARFAPAKAAATPAESAAPVLAVESSFDPASSLELVEGDQELLVELIELFLNESPRLMATIHQTNATGASAELMRAAHTLKGMSGNFGARKVVELAFELELIARSGSVAGALPLCRALDQELSRLHGALAAYKQQYVSAAAQPPPMLDAPSTNVMLQRVA
jgi:CheY-like chemotaxis protein/HPt (histidine-containing phosphotransfer) domain-containing protein